jgi:quercetin dioxygenase-like cupin family protein
MKRLAILMSLLAVLSPAPSAGVASGQPTPPGPTTVSNKRFEAASLPGPIELVHGVVDLAPGAGMPTHTHGGQVFITVLEGALTLSGDGGEQTYRASETVVEEPGHFFAATNPGAGNTRLFVSYVLPKGAPPTTVQEGAAMPAAAPTTVATGTFEIADPPAQFEVVQLLLDFPTGAWTPPHSHGGPVLVTVLEGEVTERRPGVERRFRPGQGWTENAGDLHAAGNDGAAKASVAATFLLRKGAELTTVHEALAPAAPAPAPAQVPRSR